MGAENNTPLSLATIEDICKELQNREVDHILIARGSGADTKIHKSFVFNGTATEFIGLMEVAKQEIILTMMSNNEDEDEDEDDDLAIDEIFLRDEDIEDGNTINKHEDDDDDDEEDD